MSPLFLRPYQQEALEASKRKFDAGITRQLITLPTGTGKTVLFANLLKHHGIQKKLLVLVHRRELAEQAKEKLGQCNPEIRMRIGLEMGQDEAWRRDHIVIAGVQTIGTQTGAGRLRFFNPSDFGAIVCDEAHHAIANTYRRVFEHFGLHADGNQILLLGVTATPVRSDGRLAPKRSLSRDRLQHAATRCNKAGLAVRFEGLSNKIQRRLGQRAVGPGRRLFRK